MILDKFTQFTTFRVKHPLYHQYKVLLHKGRVDSSKGHLKVIFTEAKSLMNNEWYVSQAKAKRGQKHWNGSIWCYAVDLGDLEKLEINNRDLSEVW